MESAREILGGEEEEVLFDGEDLGFRVEMVDACVGVSAGDEPQTFVLHKLETTKGSSRVVREDDWRCKVEEGTYHGFEGEGETFFVVAEGRVGKGS